MISKEQRYWYMELEEQNKKDLLKWLNEDKLIALVDEKEGGIIGYINPLFIDKITKILNKKVK